MDYMIGCNYWDSRNATEMWNQFDENIIDEDFKQLSKNGVSYLRVFPNWRDFQPVINIKAYQAVHREYCFADGGSLNNEFGLNYTMLKRFEKMCELAEKHNIKLIVAIVTGFMSGRLFVPPALEGKTELTDNELLFWTEKLVRGFVRFLKNQESIFAWDLGNECNCIMKAKSRSEAYLFCATIRNAILAEDSSRGIMSGLSSALSPYENDVWNMQDQGCLTDWLTPHPYNTAGNGGETDPMNCLKTSYLPTIEAQLYADISGKPALLQEFGGLNKIYGCDEVQADFLRVNILSSWAAGAKGALWWCAFDQLKIDFSPYSYSMRELGLFDSERQPKLNTLEMKKLSKVLHSLPFETLPSRKIDAVCILSMLSKWWPVASNTALLAKQAGLEVAFRNYRQEIPQAKIYFLPCIEGWNVTTKENFSTLLERVCEGAVLYVSYNAGVLENFEEIFGLKSRGVRGVRSSFIANFTFAEENTRLSVSSEKELILEQNGAEILAKSEAGNPVFTLHHYGKGTVYFLNFPLELMLWNSPGAFYENAPPYYKIYREISNNILTEKPVICENSQVGITHHQIDDENQIVVAINYSDKPQDIELKIKQEWSLTPLYGELEYLNACDGAVYSVRKTSYYKGAARE